jgi:hypothetical protein
MNFHISFDEPIDDQDSVNLEKLAHILSHDYELSVNKERQEPLAGVKDGGLTIAISLIGVELSAPRRKVR